MPHVAQLVRILLVLPLGMAFASPLQAQPSDIVLYPSDVTAINGNWARLSSTTGAGGQKMSSANLGWSSPNAPLAAPGDYFEATFEASAGVAYRLWLRLRGAADSKFNESVWVQFSTAANASGSPLWRIGTTSALLVNLEDCNACGIAGWGWQDNAYWLNTSSVVRFAASGTQRIRVQTREDGVDVDQIVLSPSTYATAPPGPVRNDTTHVPKTGGTPPAITLVRAPYLQQVSDHEAVIVWTTQEPGPAEVRYGPTTLSSTAPAVTRLFSATTTGLSFDFYQHEARLPGLAGATEYKYDIFVAGEDATPSLTDVFRTAPMPGTGTATFIAFGDSGTGSTAQRQLATRMASDTFDFAVHSGDVTYGNSGGTGSGRYRQYDDWFFGVYSAWLRSRAVFPSIGNHDNETASGQAYRDVFVLPEHAATGAFPDHAERYYSFDYGPVHVVVLDTETAFATLSRRQAQLEWLAADLSATAQPWKVVVFHRPPYSSGAEHGSDLAVRAAFAPVLEQHGVQLVLTGHDHDYERTKPWREYVSDGGRVTYIVTGGGGAGLYPVGTDTWTAVARSIHHYVRVSAGTGCSMSVRATAIDGTTIDQFVIDRCATPPPPAAHRVPGTIQAEDFDSGPNGTAYFDHDAGNRGGQYRSTDVDIERCGEGGYNVGWIGAGEWLTYTIDVASAGTYNFAARVASPNGGSFHVEIDGVDTTGSIAVPASGGWQAWRTVTRNVSLEAGTHVMRLAFDTSGYNVNDVGFTAAASGSTPFGGTPRSLPGIVQAEDFDDGGEGVAYHDGSTANSGGQYRSTGVDIERTGDAGGGYNVGWAGAGEWLAYTVNVTIGGTYTLVARVASLSTGGTFHIELDEVDVTGPLRVPATGSWQAFQDVGVPVSLTSGVQMLRLVMDTNGSTTGAVGNFNYITVF